MKITLRLTAISLVFAFSSTSIVLAHSGAHISNEISRTINNSVNKNISDRVIETAVKPTSVVSNKKLTSKAEVKIAQQLLNKWGFKAGIADGLMGKKTRKAIRGFQKSQGLKVDGLLTESLLPVLRSSTHH